MHQNKSIQFKAAFLLLVFSMNIGVGFACAVGLDDLILGNDHHGHDNTKIHVHKDGSKHVHHSHKAKHQHDKKEKENCCSDTVVKLALVDKSVPQTNGIISPVFYTAFIAAYYNITVPVHSQAKTSTRYFVRSYHPPIPDIRIAIQSFQI